MKNDTRGVRWEGADDEREFALFFFPRYLLLSVITKTVSFETQVTITSPASYSRNVRAAPARSYFRNNFNNACAGNASHGNILSAIKNRRGEGGQNNRCSSNRK